MDATSRRDALTAKAQCNTTDAWTHPSPSYYSSMTLAVFSVLSASELASERQHTAISCRPDHGTLSMLSLKENGISQWSALLDGAALASESSATDRRHIATAPKLQKVGSMHAFVGYRSSTASNVTLPSSTMRTKPSLDIKLDGGGVKCKPQQFPGWK